MSAPKLLVERDPHQTRVALLEEDRLAELFVERHRDRGVVGNVYKGRVKRVLPGMQAAFLDVGLDRDAFLYVDDVRETYGDMEEPESSETERGEAPIPIEDLLRPGAEVLVQVAKDPVPSKGARVTTHLSFPGRLLVFAPLGRHRGVSKRIEDPEERSRLRDLLADLPPGGWIVRTAAEGDARDALESDARALLERWEGVRERAEEATAPSLVGRELDLALRVVRDRFGPEFSMLWVEGDEIYEELVELLEAMDPSLVDKVRRHRRETPLFESFDLEEAIEEALRPKVWLKSGGYLVIQPTEALVAIDVNTGRFVGGEDLDRTILKTNLEAIREIVRQIRLRNLGGILVLDLIDMTVPAHREQVFDALENELRRDRARSRILAISEFGLVEVTRKRSRPSLERMLTAPCPYCLGEGRIRSVTTIVLSIRRDLLTRGVPHGARELLLRAHPDVAAAFQGEGRSVAEEVQRRLGVTLLVRSDPGLHHERFEILEVG